MDPYTFGTSTACVCSDRNIILQLGTSNSSNREYDGSSWTSVTNMPNEQGALVLHQEF